ncbi:SDR family oxidoreductase [Limibacter armeniacum]|uniref:SDR family oxidoreductase n=1 Tax=Limibacter armeniacum TaxID=466084 RepID=UPI002FE66BB4
MAKILITGATGGLGSTVTAFLGEKLPTEDIAVMVRDSNSEKAVQFRQKGIEVREGDYDQPESLNEAFTGIEVLYFVSGNDLVARFEQHKNVVNAAKKADIKHILYTSSVRKNESEDAPLHLVVGLHAQTEELIKESGINYTLLRHNLYGEVIPMFIGDKAKLLESKTIYLPTGKGSTAFVSRRDLAEAAANILADAKAHENKIYEFNGSQTVTFEQIAQIISEVTGEQINYVSPTKEDFESTMASYGLPEGIIGMLTMFSLGIADGEFDQQVNDFEKILGRETQSMKDFLTAVYA